MSDNRTIDLKPISALSEFTDYTQAQVDLLRAQICPDLNDNELKLFLQICRKTQLDPFARQIYAQKRKTKGRDGAPDVLKMVTLTGIDGYRLIAERTGKYRGQDPVLWCGDDGVWKDVWLSREPPAAAKVGVWKEGFEKPIVSVALYDEYVQIAYSKPVAMWERMPSGQLAKCAEALALRKAFPQETSGVYTKEEMDQADNTAPYVPPQIEQPRADEKEEKAIVGKQARTPEPAKVVEIKPEAEKKATPPPAPGKTDAEIITARRDALEAYLVKIGRCNSSGSRWTRIEFMCGYFFVKSGSELPRDPGVYYSPYNAIDLILADEELISQLISTPREVGQKYAALERSLKFSEELKGKDWPADLAELANNVRKGYGQSEAEFREWCNFLKLEEKTHEDIRAYFRACMRGREAGKAIGDLNVKTGVSWKDCVQAIEDMAHPIKLEGLSAQQIKGYAERAAEKLLSMEVDE